MNSVRNIVDCPEPAGSTTLPRLKIQCFSERMIEDQKSGSMQTKYRVALVRSEGGQDICVYPMFERAYLSAAGGFLAGEVFLEVGEVVTIQISFVDEVLNVTARVDGLQFGDAPGVTVTFVDSSEAEKQALAARFPQTRRVRQRRRKTDGGLSG